MGGIKGVDVFRGLEKSLNRGKFSTDDFHGSTGMGGRILPPAE